jgi:hypothetical protein
MDKDPGQQGELRSVKQLQGRFVRVTSAKALAAMRKAGVNADHWWHRRPAERAERDLKFFSQRSAHNTGPALERFTCAAVVRGKRCNRITIIETGHRHCIKHAGPHFARIYRENQRKLFESGRISAAKWFKDEARRTRTRIRDQQRRKRDGWTLPGATLRFAEPIEARFRMDVAPLLPHPWSDIPDLHRDQLRWAWRRFMLDRQKPEAWDGKARAIMQDLRDRGPFDSVALEHASGLEPHVLVCARRATAYEWRSRLSQAEVARAIQAPARGRGATATPSSRAAPTGPPRLAGRAGRGGFDHTYQRLLHRHGRDLRDVLARVDETAWPALLAAYDAYTGDPTLERHRRWMKLATHGETGGRGARSR